jgi:PPOX class probable F420-dependent enzyme
VLDITTEAGGRAERRLREDKIGWLTTVRSVGQPQSVPVWFLWDGEGFLIYSQPHRQKLKNIGGNPRVGLHLNSHDRGDDVVRAEETAEIVDDFPPASEVGEHVERYRESIARIGLEPESFARAYFDYFGAKAGDRTKGYYSYDAGNWHFVVLNSNCAEVGGCGKQSPQGRWLRADLANHPAACTAAAFHHPLYTSSTADTTIVRPFWDMLYKEGADVILSGHAHYYERFLPQRPDGTFDPFYGLHEFVVGTGGAAPTNPMRFPRAANSFIDSEKKNEPGKTAYGVLDLYAGSYAWEFLPIEGETFTDSGTGQCHGKPR